MTAYTTICLSDQGEGSAKAGLPVSLHRLARQGSPQLCLVPGAVSPQGQHDTSQGDWPGHCPLQVSTICVLYMFYNYATLLTANIMVLFNVCSVGQKIIQLTIV